MTFLAQYKKAVVAAVLAALSGVGASLADGSLTLTEVGIAVGAGIVAGVGVAKVTNQPAP